MKEWFFQSLLFVRAHHQHDFSLKKKWFYVLREAVILSQINKQKKIKAHRFRIQNLKYDFIWFLKEYVFEQDLKRARR